VLYVILTALLALAVYAPQIWVRLTMRRYGREISAMPGTGGELAQHLVDRFEINGKWLELPVMGTFEVADGKITAWRDYFDLNQFQSQLS